MTGALADPRRAAHRARPEALDRRTLVGVDRLARRGPRRRARGCSRRWRPPTRAACSSRARPHAGVSEDSSRLLNALPADVVAHQTRLARRGAHVLGLRPHDRRRQARVALAAASTGGRRSAGFSRRSPLRLTATAARAPESTASGSLPRPLQPPLVVLVLVLGPRPRRPRSDSSSSSPSASSSAACALGFVVGLEHDVGGVLGRDVRRGRLDLVGFRLGLSVGRLVGLGRGRLLPRGHPRLPACEDRRGGGGVASLVLVSH